MYLGISGFISLEFFAVQCMYLKGTQTHTMRGLLCPHLSSSNEGRWWGAWTPLQQDTSFWESEWRVSIQATDASTPNASYIEPSVRLRSINRWISARFMRCCRLATWPFVYLWDVETCRTLGNKTRWQSSVSQLLSLSHSCAQSRAQWDQCGGTCDSRDPDCQWPVMTMDPLCAAAPRARRPASVYCAVAFVVKTSKKLNIEMRLTIKTNVFMRQQGPLCWNKSHKNNINQCSELTNLTFRARKDIIQW